MRKLIVMLGAFFTFLVVDMVYAAGVVPVDLYPSPSDLQGSWLISSQFKALLLTIIILGVMTEIKTAGAGIAGGTAIIAAIALFSLNFLSGRGGVEEIILFIVGAGLLVIEIFIPGFGIFGIGGILCILGSFYFILGANGPALSWLAGSLVAAIGIFAILVKYLPHNPAWNLVVLKDKQSNDKGYSGSPVLTEYLGKIGLAITPLRPSGTALIDDKRVDVVTTGEFIEIGEQVKVIKVEGPKILVQKEI